MKKVGVEELNEDGDVASLQKPQMQRLTNREHALLRRQQALVSRGPRGCQIMFCLVAESFKLRPLYLKVLEEEIALMSLNFLVRNPNNAKRECKKELCCRLPLAQHRR